MIHLDTRKIRAAALMTNAAVTKVILVLGGYWLGHKLDEKLHTGPWLMILGIVIGVSSGLWYVLFTAQRISGDGSKKDHPE